MLTIFNYVNKNLGISELDDEIYSSCKKMLKYLKFIN